MDGPAGLNQAPVEPGSTFMYDFIAEPAGSRWYHAHTDPAMQIPMGLYGPLIIEPAVAEEQFDREYTLMLGEWDNELTPAVATGAEDPGAGDAMLRGGELGSDLFLINGHMYGAIDPIRVALKERILIRVMNAGHHAHPLHIHGHSFTIVATDGNPVPPAGRWTKDTVLVGPAERYDLALTADNPGVWMVHCHIEHHMAGGMMTTLWYDGYQPSGPAADLGGGMDDHAQHAPAATPAVINESATPVPADSGAVVVRLLDDRFDPKALEIPAGTTVTWENHGRHMHSIVAADGSFASGAMISGAHFSFTFSVPGTYPIHCRQHALAGMASTITVL